MTMTSDERADAVWTMLGYAVEGDASGAALSLATIGASSTSDEMYGVCCAIAEAAKAVLKRMFPCMIWAPSAYLVAHGVCRNRLTADAADAWAAEFIVAYANGDTAATNALYSAALTSGADRYSDSVCALLASFAGLAQTQLQSAGITP